jgi:hypothetical protein
MIEENHIELKWFRHIEGFSEISKIRGGTANDKLDISADLSFSITHLDDLS